ncbi:dihydroorotase [soil metagenome]
MTLNNSDTLTLIKPDDWHTHLRDGAVLTRTVADTAKRFARAIVMPNLKPAITTTQAALAYRERILAALVPGDTFEPLMTLYLTDSTPVAEVTTAKQSGKIFAFKLYPAGATTNAAAGVTHMTKVYEVCSALEQQQVPLLLHGEVTDPAVDIFDREKIFIDKELVPLLQRFPKLRIVLEHITTQEAVDFVREGPANLAATITAHHLLLNRNDLFLGGIKPHYYCLPLLKRERHQQALIQAAISANSKFFLGTDSAPHALQTKEAACGCAGIYTAHAAIELYAEVFASVNALDKLEAFASFYGADFYGLARNTETLSLVKQEWSAPASLAFGNDLLVPFRAEQTIGWKMVE